MAGQVVTNPHDVIRLAYRERRYKDALDGASRLLNENPDDCYAMLIVSRCMGKVERYGIAAVLARRATEIAPSDAQTWNSLGYALMMIEPRMEEAEGYFKKALAVQPDMFSPMANLICIAVNKGDPVEALKWAEKASWVYTEDEIEDEYKDVGYNRGLAELMLGNWKDGWRDYCHSPRHRIKKEWAYGEEPRWDGKPTDCLVVYGEQGLGDEIMFASAIPDAMALCREVVVDCDPRLAGLFARSFPEAHVYGTRHDTVCPWIDAHKITARAGGADVCRFTRNSFEDFPGRPFLKADLERRVQWGALLDTLGAEPKIGLAWTGGKKGHSFMERRSLTLKQLEPILRQRAVWVDLEYRDAKDEIAAFMAETGIRINHWPHAILTQDYDDTAALVAELDLVISVTTTIVNLSGALGVECWCMVPKRASYREGLIGDYLPWYGHGVRLFRQAERDRWEPVIETVAEKLRVFLAEKEADRWAYAS